MEHFCRVKINALCRICARTNLNLTPMDVETLIFFNLQSEVRIRSTLTPDLAPTGKNCKNFWEIRQKMCQKIFNTKKLCKKKSCNNLCRINETKN